MRSNSATHALFYLLKHKIRPNSLDTAFESKILSLLTQRRSTLGTKAVVTCGEAEEETLKDEAGLADSSGQAHGGDVAPDQKPPRSRERCRQAARRLAAKGEVLVTQGGQVVDPSFAKGTMELKLSK
ncbi:hypothetical protein D0Z07_1083 [Hyphodiscus hymeniophilus]|uniref:DUF3253 domain-containing protein n=1 Tax=Hyphodiscus hymeniophilus TaxID=353542 RepID=A0A9P6VQM7_9HELO|nr:hypothetical protein D0Z07_1083 [Hyphodiscus hymeniophilus]